MCHVALPHVVRGSESVGTIAVRNCHAHSILDILYFVFLYARYIIQGVS